MKAAPIKAATAKVTAKPVKVKPLKDKLNRTQRTAHLAATSEVELKGMCAVLAALEATMLASLHKRGVAEFSIPAHLSLITLSLTYPPNVLPAGARGIVAAGFAVSGRAGERAALAVEAGVIVVQAARTRSFTAIFRLYGHLNPTRQSTGSVMESKSRPTQELLLHEDLLMLC